MYVCVCVRACVYIYMCVCVCIWSDSPHWTRHSSFTMFLDHTQRRTKVGRSPLDEWSARCRGFCLTIHNTHNRETSMPPMGFGPTISVRERPQTYALHRAATGTGMYVCVCMYVCIMYLCMCVCMYVCMYLCVYVYVCMYVCMCMYVCTYVWRMYVYTQTKLMGYNMIGSGRGPF
jgi:Flp pilus assembly protein TadB